MSLCPLCRVDHEAGASAERPDVVAGDQVHFVPDPAWGRGTGCWDAVVASVETDTDGAPLRLAVIAPDSTAGRLNVPVFWDAHAQQPVSWHMGGHHGARD